MRRLLRYFVLLAFLAVANAAFAQGTGSLSGKVMDPNGLAVEGLDLQNLAVSIKDASGKTYSAPVTRGGDYSITLPAGAYDLYVPVFGAMYLAFDEKGVAIAAGANVKLDIKLPWGMNLGTIGDDPIMLSNDLRAKSKFVDGPTPRTADGKPDFTGVWYDIPGTPRPGPKMKPWALEIEAQMKKILANNLGGADIQRPQAFCLPLHATPTATPFPYRFVQTPTLMVQLTEFLAEGWRQIFMDGRPHPPADEWNPSWYGHSIGRWEGDTLVVDTVGFNESTPGYGVHTEKLHVVERITRPSVGKLHIQITADDPEAWTEPLSFSFDAGLVTGEEILEFMCQENNKDALHFGGLGWRARP
jgi:hypothetical protein